MLVLVHVQLCDDGGGDGGDVRIFLCGRHGDGGLGSGNGNGRKASLCLLIFGLTLL